MWERRRTAISKLLLDYCAAVVYSTFCSDLSMREPKYRIIMAEGINPYASYILEFQWDGFSCSEISEEDYDEISE